MDALWHWIRADHHHSFAAFNRRKRIKVKPPSEEGDMKKHFGQICLNLIRRKRPPRIQRVFERKPNDVYAVGKCGFCELRTFVHSATLLAACRQRNRKSD